MLVKGWQVTATCQEHCGTLTGLSYIGREHLYLLPVTLKNPGASNTIFRRGTDLS
jgi:hypothetical protein